ncbi:cytochrome c peroxidase [Olivibacter ginsenosidimutans]|uniref:Cytochrome c peroxidase n=1 Tax=Olivibacter ginsenosidimutans TaxID=1176537 RepID=A0ABP9BVW2_9SPHI
MIYWFCSCEQAKESREQIIEREVLSQVEHFTALVEHQFIPAVQGAANQDELQKLFLELRFNYKSMEWAVEYFTGSTSRFVNGPPVEEISLTGLYVFQPEGLQVMEDLLFPTYDKQNRQALLHYSQLLLEKCDAYRAYFANIPIADWQVLDAAKQEVFRILTLGITGFDNPLTLRSMEESAICLERLNLVLKPYMEEAKTDSLRNLISSGAQYLRKHPDFNSFDRAYFIRNYGNPMTASLTDLAEKLSIRFIQYNRLLRQDARTLFDKRAFDVNAYTPGVGYRVTEKRKELGKKLFFDPVLSDGHGRSCASCHQPDKAFTDGLVKNTILDHPKPLLRNTPTLLNAALQPMQFYDLRALSLEDQVSDVVHNNDEMHGSLRKAAQILWLDTTYRRSFTVAYPKKQRKSIDTLEIVNAISSYIRGLSELNSRFDQYMRGNTHAMQPQEIEGFNLFMGKAKCATCHFMPLFNGAVPPKFYTMDAEVIGVPQTADAKVIDPDLGRYKIMPFESLRHAFKTVTVRNVSKTAPYMHNGIFKTLDEVIDFYNNGGGEGMGITVANQTLSPDSLHLTKEEINQLKAFMNSLDNNGQR